MQDFFFSQKITNFPATFLLAIALAVLAGCSNSGGGTTVVTTPPPVTGSATVANIQISGNPLTIKTDNATFTTITVIAVDASNAAVSGATITLSASSGMLTTSTLITDATGRATTTFYSGVGAANQTNRTATITATSGAATALLPVQIVGSTLTLSSTSTSIAIGGASPATLTITAKDAAGNAISGAAVTLTQTPILIPGPGGTVTFTPASGTTNASGVLTVSVGGGAIGAVTVSAAAAGVTATLNYTVALTGGTFNISHLTLNGGTPLVPVNPKNSAMQLGDSLDVEVTAPLPTTTVLFATTIGYWSGATAGTIVAAPGTGVGTAYLIVTTTAGAIATATLQSAAAGNAIVEVLDSTTGTPTDTLTVGITAKIASKITLQAFPTVIPKSVGSTVGYSNLTAMVYDANNQPVGGLPVGFEIVSGTGTGSGETVSPVVVYSASTTMNGLALGASPTVFTSGSLSSASTGVQIRASVIGTAIATTLIGGTGTTSSTDAAIVVGGTAGSVAFGQATKIIDLGDTSTIYSFPMSVLVADSNGSPAPKGTVVNISVSPIAWSTGSGCVWDPDGFVWDPVALAWVAGNGGTFYTEDTNQNLILDAGEDGVRKYYATGAAALGTGIKDGQLTPLNSWAGTLASTNPIDLAGTATTDETGLAKFNLTYTKSSANWVVARIRAQTVVQGSPAVGQLDWRLVASKADSVPCVLPPSPFKF